MRQPMSSAQDPTFRCGAWRRGGTAPAAVCPQSGRRSHLAIQAASVGEDSRPAYVSATSPKKGKATDKLTLSAASLSLYGRILTPDEAFVKWFLQKKRITAAKKNAECCHFCRLSSASAHTSSRVRSSGVSRRTATRLSPPASITTAGRGRRL